VTLGKILHFAPAAGSAIRLFCYRSKPSDLRSQYEQVACNQRQSMLTPSRIAPKARKTFPDSTTGARARLQTMTTAPRR
jgi:hypothetical protein